MNVCGSHNKTRLPLRSDPATCASNFRSFVQTIFHFAANFSTSKKPALCRVCAYFAPGFPNPTMRCKDSMRGKSGNRRKNYFFFSALASGFASAFLSPAGAAFASPLAAEAAAASSFFSLVIFDIASSRSSSGRGHFFLGARCSDSNNRDVLVTQNLHTFGRLNITDMK